MTREEVVTIAREWINTPWRHQASLKGVGVDCGGLIRGVGVEAGLMAIEGLMKFRGYGRQPHEGMMEEACDAVMDRASMAHELADVLLMRFGTGDPQHLAIVVGVNPVYIVHAYAQARKVVEHRLDAVWESRIVRCYRFRDIE